MEGSFTLIPYLNSIQNSVNGDRNLDGQLFIVPGIGYRYQQQRGGIFSKVALSSVLFLDPPSNDFWNMDPKLLGGISASLGWSF